jgi:hypothetical protein
MLRVFLIVAVACCLLAQRAATQPRGSVAADSILIERLAKLEAILPTIQKQLEENSKQLVDVQKDLASLSAKMNLVVWLGSGIGVILLGVAGKLFFEPKGVSQGPLPSFMPMQTPYWTVQHPRTPDDAHARLEELAREGSRLNEELQRMINDKKVQQ